MTLEEAKRIAHVVNESQEIDFDTYQAMVLVDLIKESFPEFNWKIDNTGEVTVKRKKNL